ncbi:hypothetical protein BDZ97DRAFT_1764215 [Flammula alnicola]|nr:hypothetical protein BDZ97DRAFT_1764215 [Flammula alnicola]
MSDSNEAASASADRAAGAGGGDRLKERKSRVQPPFFKSGSSALPLPPPAPASSSSLATITASSNRRNTKTNPDYPRAPHPDMAPILSSTPRPALSKHRQKREDKEEEEGEGDSDSSLELDTLPHLIVYHGLLWPDSKLLPGAQSRVNTLMDERLGSILNVVSNDIDVAEVASITTKSGLIKDERDTPNRRRGRRCGVAAYPPFFHSQIISSIISILHHDQRLLESEREGEFDNYDEYDDEEEDNTLKESGEQAWQTVVTANVMAQPHRRDDDESRSSIGTRTARVVLARVSRWRLLSRLVIGRNRPRGLGSQRLSGDEPSSTLSIPMPITPKYDFDSIASTTTTLSVSRQRVYDKEKSLPPLPASGLKMSSNSSRTEGIGCGGIVRAAHQTGARD